MIAEIIPFPEAHPWSKYTYDAESRANAEELYEVMLGLREKLGPAKGDGTQPITVESAERLTVELLKACRESSARLRAKGVPPPAS